MLVYGNIIVCGYKLHKQLNNKSPYFAALIFLVLNQMLAIALILAAIKNVIGINLFPAGKDYKTISLTLVPILFVWVFLLSKYYTKSRLNQLEIDFDEKSNKEKTLWYVLCICSILIPLIGLPLLLSK